MAPSYSIEQSEGRPVLVIRIPIEVKPEKLTIVAVQPGGLLPTGRLSGRELEVYERILQRKQNKEIADELCISLRGVKYHVASIMRKMNCESRADLWFRSGVTEGT